MKRFAALLLALMLMVALLPACAESSVPAGAREQVYNLLDGVLAGETARAGAETTGAWIRSLAERAGSGAEWQIFALSRLPDLVYYGDLLPCREALEACAAQADTLTAAARQKLALCMLALGGSAGVEETAMETIGRQGVMTWIFGLHLLNNGIPGSCTRSEAAAKLLSLQKPDGGWAVMGSASDVDVTAMALQALAPCREDAAVETAVQKAVSLLSRRQLPDGGYASMGAANPESAAQVLIALCSLGIDPMDERFVKDGNTLLSGLAAYALPDGCYSHTPGGDYSPAATGQVLMGLAAYSRYLNGQTGLFLLDHPQESNGTQGGNAASLGIIGGADGPTTILLTPPGGWRVPAMLGVGGLALVWCILSLCRGRRKWKHLLPPLLVAAVLIAAICFIEIQTPEDYYTPNQTSAGESTGSAMLEIRCDVLPEGTENAPRDGCILQKTSFPIYAGDTVYDLLTRAAREHRLQLDTSGAPGMVYVSGLQYLYEQAHGELSGWMFFVNGQSASRSCDQYTLRDGDSILWAYTCQMGADLP